MQEDGEHTTASGPAATEGGALGAVNPADTPTTTSRILSTLLGDVTHREDVAHTDATTHPDLQSPNVICSNNCNPITDDSGATTVQADDNEYDPYNIALYSTLTICMAIIVLIILFMTAAILFTRYKSWKRKREVGIKNLQEQLGASVSPAFALIARRGPNVAGDQLPVSVLSPLTHQDSLSRPVAQHTPPVSKPPPPSVLRHNQERQQQYALQHPRQQHARQPLQQQRQQQRPAKQSSLRAASISNQLAEAYSQSKQ